MRNQLLIFFCILPLFIWAESIPEGYYNEAQGLSDSLLKSALYDTISRGIRFSYGTQGYTYPDSIYYTATWNYFPITDRRSDGTIWDMYSSAKRYFPYDGGSACGIQIEHCMPKSWWGWKSSDTGSSKRAYQDLYILTPADAQANGQKSNYPPGHVVEGDKFDNGSFRMDKAASSQYGRICFEPAAEYRGDFARTYFYVVTAYQDLTWNATYSDYLTNSSYLVFQPDIMEVLLDWHRADPVSKKEIERADAISTLQHNRNPFIDYPELVEYIWGNKKGQTVDFNTLVCTASSSYVPAEDFTDFTAYPPSDLSRIGFTARWSNFDTDYTIDVYTRTYTGNNDTLINLPAVTANILVAHPLTSYSGKLNSAGTNAVTMGSSTTDGAIILSGLQLTQPAVLCFRANIYQTATSGELSIYIDDNISPDTTIILPASRDEIRYTINLPAGTDSVTIASIGGSTTKRACMQELYLIQGNLTETVTSLEGFPLYVTKAEVPSTPCTRYISLPANIGSDTIFYHISSSEGKLSNEVKLILSPNTHISDAPHISGSTLPARKVLHNGNIYILQDNHYYTPLGQKRQLNK